ncbi:MAG: response regulator, partial [Chitinophagaceae bacterium]|nr:response regulator [Chitinophagaceae bacterium]
MKAPLKTLFLIDDDELYLFTMKKMVEKNKLVDNLHEFHNGFDAIEFLNLMAANKYVLPDVILLDINMPVMDGWTFMELFSLLKPKLEKQISVYMITS